MKLFTKNPLFFILCLLICLSTNTIQAQEFDGYALYNSGGENTTYLIDKNGDIAHTWSLDRPCNYAVLLTEDGNLMRGATAQGNIINGAAIGGLVQEIDPDGNVIWEFEYSSADYISHHDITLMPNQNVLLIAWEVVSAAELQALGYDGNSYKYVTHFIEVSQIGNTNQGEIVWEWHMMDHFVQDEDSSLPNYGVISEHPELLNINVETSGGFGGPGGPPGGDADWFHVNGINYNAELDQIVFSSRYLNEIFIIDHSTTTEEAAGHTGGNAGKGGDFLYRWGKPSNYDTPGTQTFPAAVHDARFIPDDGRPRGGFVQVFNNEGNNGDSTIDAIELPFAADGYNYIKAPGQPYGPTDVTWRHECLDNAWGQSASNSMPNGNVFAAVSNELLYEVNLQGDVVWQYNASTLKAFRYTCDYNGIQVLMALGVIEPLCTPPVVDGVETLKDAAIQLAPNPSTGIFNIEGLTQHSAISSVQVFDVVGKKVLEQNQVNITSIDLSDKVAGIYFVTIQLANKELITRKVSVID